MRVLRDEDMVIVTVAGGGPAYNGCGFNTALLENVLHDYFTGAIIGSSPLAPNPLGVARLASLIEEASLPDNDPPDPVPPLPAIAESISRVRFKLDDNPGSLEWLKLTFTGGSEALLEYQEGTQRFGMSVGLDNIFRKSVGAPDLLFATKGRWVGNNRFTMLLDQSSLRRYYYAELLFEGDSVTITLEDLACGEAPVTLIGHKLA